MLGHQENLWMHSKFIASAISFVKLATDYDFDNLPIKSKQLICKEVTSVIEGVTQKSIEQSNTETYNLVTLMVLAARMKNQQELEDLLQVMEFYSSRSQQSIPKEILDLIPAFYKNADTVHYIQ